MTCKAALCKQQLSLERLLPPKTFELNGHALPEAQTLNPEQGLEGLQKRPRLTSCMSINSSCRAELSPPNAGSPQEWTCGVVGVSTASQGPCVRELVNHGTRDSLGQSKLTIGARFQGRNVPDSKEPIPATTKKRNTLTRNANLHTTAPKAKPFLIVALN